MLYKSSTVKIKEHRTACLVVAIDKNKQPETQFKTADKILSGQISKLRASGDLSDKAGENLILFNQNINLISRMLCVGLSQRSNNDYCKMAKSLIKTLRQTKINTLSLALDIKENHYQVVRTLIGSFEQELYEYDTSKSKKNKAINFKKIIFLCATKKIKQQTDLAIKHSVAITSGITLARELGNLPANICTPTYLATKARAIAKNSDRLTVNILSEKQMKKLKMEALLSVTHGTFEPAKLIVFKYKGNKNQKPIVLIGKGVTFDSGGITLKQGAAMDEMKFDMCGAASVFGVIQALTQLKPTVNVIGIVPATENLPSGKAAKPGDVVKSMSGQTIEILSTDAEGRMILCDAISYAKKFKPEVVIDIATLTGACITALGKHASGLMTNNQKLAQDLINAGKESHDRLWQLPLWQEYDKLLNSNFADMANVGPREAGAGAIVAGSFLKRFAKDYKWAHIDIAGTAWIRGKKKGATGRPVSLLFQYILSTIKGGGDYR